MFVPLHSHSEYSIADGLFSPKTWAKEYKERGFKAAALTDHGTLGGTMEFYHAMKENGVTPILGAEFYFVDNPTLKVKENRKANHLILIAKSYDGYQNLMKLSRLSYTEGFFYKPRIGTEWLTQYREGLVCLTACQGGVLSNEIWREKDGKPCMGLEKRFKALSAIFGDDLYVEFQGHNTIHKDKETEEESNSQEMINQHLYGLRKLKGFQPICTNDNHYILPEHSDIQATLKQMAYGNNDAGQSYTHCDSLYLKDARQVYEAFRTHHEYLPKEFVASALKNTEAVLEKCKGFALPEGKRYLPIFRDKVDSADLFKKLTFKLLQKFIKLGTLHASKEEYVARFKTEFQVISRYKLQDYFLIVWDLVRFAEERGIFVGIGRGSSAGSFISYLLGIVKIDPLQYNLIFERFLNENRCETGELPDIDLDFESERRDEVKEYIFERYGRDRVCEIGTYGRMMLKTSLIDFGKALGIVTSKDILAITTQFALDKEDANDLEAAAGSDVRLRQLLDDNENYRFFVSEIIGQIKSQGIHPAGVIICPENVETITPVKTQAVKGEKDAEGKPLRIVVTQSEDTQVTAQGIMKMDILGLKEYDVIKYVIEHAPGIPFTRENYLEYILAADSKPIWKMFQKGETSGVFQFASSGMQDLLRQMKPNKMGDLMAANALFRPGCLENGWHIDYCERKHGRDPVEFIHPDLEKAVGDTYGVICVAEGSLVSTRSGLVPIESVPVGEDVLTENGEFCEVEKVIDNGIRAVIRVRFSNGEDLVCTPDHQVLTSRGWVEAATLGRDDLVKSFWSEGGRVEIGDDKDWLIGLTLADGNCCSSQVDIACCGEQFADRLIEITNRTYKLNAKKYLHGTCWHVAMTGFKSGSANRNPFYTELRRLDIFGKNCYTKRFPKNFSLSLLAGFIEGDGSLINNRVRLKNRDMAFDLYLGLQSFKIPSSFYDDDGVSTVAFHDWERKLPFRIKEFSALSSRDYLPREYLPKLPRSNNDRQHGRSLCPYISKKIVMKYREAVPHDHWSRVLSVRVSQKARVFDLSVRGTHSFVVGGHVVHNCYQEQFMSAIHLLGGISLAEADTIRSALGKKNKEKLDKFRLRFVEGASAKMGEDAAQTFWEQIEKAAGYTFNRSHAAAYSVLAYVSQYLKFHYPAYFWSGQLDWDVRKNKLDEMLLNRRAASEMNVNFCMPHINDSREGFYIRGSDVMWPLRGVKGVGPKAAAEVVRAQPFKDFADFHGRVNKSKVKYNNIQALIYCGCFDDYGDRRELLRELASLCKGKRYTALSEEDMVFKFYESMGFFEQKLKRLRGFDKDCSTEEQLREYDVGEYVAVGGMITEIRSIKTKRGDAMGFATLMDLDEMIELTIFPKQWATFRELLRSGAIVQAAGVKSGYGGKENHLEVQLMEKK